MDPLAFEHYLNDGSRKGVAANTAAAGSAGSSLCGDVVRIGLIIASGVVESARFEAEGCGATFAAASACTELVEGSSLLDVATTSTESVAEQLGGLSELKIHAAELVSDALHRAISAYWTVSDVEPLAFSSERVLVAISGGVDSAVAAQLLLERGREVIAVTLKLWADPITDGSKACCSPQAVVAARALAHSMDIPHFTLDLQKSFRETVVDNYLVEHRLGRTPNPCVRCNGSVRFDAMLNLADLLGAEKLVTGHYARIVADDSGLLLAAAEDPNKDQTYMLSALDPELLQRLEFPLGSLKKSEVRRLAAEAGLTVAKKPESQDLCFLAGSGRSAFLARHGKLPDRSGEIVDRNGRKLGVHRGHHNFTIGQRKGIGVSAAKPLFVLDVDAENNKVTVGPSSDLKTESVAVHSARLYRPAVRVDRVKLRYRQDPVPCSLHSELGEGTHGCLNVSLDRPVKGVAPGQTACFLERDQIIGWGVIAAAA